MGTLKQLILNSVCVWKVA